MRTMVRCKDCEYCEMLCQANTLYSGSGRLYGRGEFYCTNPETGKLPNEAFGSKMREFIGYGTPERESKLQVKTSPRWCPKRKKGEKNEQTDTER